MIEIPGKISDSKKIYTVSQLNRQIRLLLESNYPGVWVEAEISNLKRHSSGHIYLTLKDENAQIQAAFFSRYQAGLKFELKDGLKVIAFCRVSIYEARGQYQLYIEKIEPQGLGSLQLAFLQLKEKLEKEGLFSAARKRPIPKFPKTIGIVTSPTGAAIHDILNVIGRRFSGTDILLYPVRVQGDGAGQEIAEAIRAMNCFKGVDVLIVGRGGGSLEDLWAFNDEIVARAVFDSHIPVISAVGHETDWTICDFVADLRAPTPSAAAELVVQNKLELEDWIEALEVRMRRSLLNMVQSRREKLESLETSYAFRRPHDLVDRFSERLDEIARQIQSHLRSLIAIKKQDFQNNVGRLNALSPLGILGRGYSITFNHEGKILKTAAQLKKGEKITTALYQGQVISEVLEIQKEGKVHG